MSYFLFIGTNCGVRSTENSYNLCATIFNLSLIIDRKIDHIRPRMLILILRFFVLFFSIIDREINTLSHDHD